MKKQGANNGASLSFLISTPESGVDSIALTYSLLDPIMTVIRPVVAFVTAMTAGIIENFTGNSYRADSRTDPDLTCTVDGCCDGVDCEPGEHARHHTFVEKMRAGVYFAFDELMQDIVKWFLLGILLAGIITYLVPDSYFETAFSPGIFSYLAMLGISLPMYVCATMSTPIAAALILKGLSPGAALVFLVAGPATNAATITVVWGMLGKRTLAIYLGSIAILTLLFGYMTDFLYSELGISAQATAGSAAELFPLWMEWTAAAVLAALCIRTAWMLWLKPTAKKAEPEPTALGSTQETQDSCSSCEEPETSDGGT